MGLGISSKVTSLHDGGDKIVCTTSLERIGEAVARALLPEHVQDTANKPIYVYSAAVSDRKMTSIVSNLTGIEFKENNQSIDTMTEDAYAAHGKGDMSKDMVFYIPFCFGDGYGGDFRYTASNEMLGLKEMTDGELGASVKAWLKEKDTSQA